MKVATLENFTWRGGNQSPGDPGVGKVREGGREDFFPLKKGGGDWPWMTLCTLKDFQVNIHGTEITETNELGEKILSKMCIAAAALIQLYTVGSKDFLMKKHHELQN